jgi:enoyl-CoA hydratase
MNDFFRLDHDADHGIATLELSRPGELNTLSPAFFGALRETVQALSDAGRTRVLVLRSTGRHFSAGMSLDVFEAGYELLRTGSAREREAFQQGLRRLMACVDVLDQARFPTVCAVQGGCVGGGLDLAVACDVRLCTQDAFFTVQEIHIGMAADLGVLQRLPKIVPAGVAREMAYSGDRVGAERALAVGLVNTVLPDAAALHAHADDLARRIAANPPHAVRMARRLLREAWNNRLDSVLEMSSAMQAVAHTTEDHKEALAAMREKRKPTYKGA